ncbi:MAG TPA: hypothetical protein VGL58_02910 [Caulobacteraceae bacterium]|jgi:LPS-assembly lipoprotein
MSVRAAIVALAGLVALAPALSGCGFTPLYAGAPGTTTGLTHIKVVAPQGRAGYLVGQSLNDDLGLDATGAPLYRLDLTVNELRAGHGLNAIAVSQRFELDLTVGYSLVDLASGKEVHKGSVTAIASYDSADQPYAGIAARQDTESRVAADAAQRVEVQVAAWLSSHPAS